MERNYQTVHPTAILALAISVQCMRRKMNLHETCQEKKKSNFQLSASPVYKEDPLLALTSVTLGSNLLELFIALWENEKKFSIFSLLCVSIQFLMFIFHQQCSLKDSLLLSSSHLQIRPFQIRPSHTTPNKQKYQQVPASLLPLSRCTIFNTDLMKSLFYSSSAKYGL